MKKKLNIIWVDDNPKRKSAAENLQDALNAKVDFINLKNESIDDKLSQLISMSEPDLIIMDHSLNDGESPTYKTGSTAASFIHEEWYQCPIISITGVDINEVDFRQKFAYEEMFQINKISKHYDSIKAIALGFRKMKSKRIITVYDLIDLFEAPEDEKEKIIKILPRELKENLKNKSLLLEIFRWCETIFFERPGFLYDRQWTATLLGLSPLGFKKVEKHFNKAKYTGVFETKSNERWWKSKLLRILSEKVNEVGLPNEMGRLLIKRNKSYYSKCYASDEEYPETVAAVDETRYAKWYPMKLKHTEPHPKFENMLFFDELRIMKPAE